MLFVHRLLVCSPLIVLSCGLLYWAMKESKPSSYLLGFQVLIGVGVAAFLQQIIIAAQVRPESYVLSSCGATDIVETCFSLG